MVLPSLLLKEKIVSLSELKINPKRALKGFVRVVFDDHGLKTSGFFMDKEAFLEILESMEYSNAEFWTELKKSRSSGRVLCEYELSQ